MPPTQVRRWIIRVFLLGVFASWARWQFGPPPPLQEIRLKPSLFSLTQFPIAIRRPGQYRLMSDFVVTDPDIDAIQILTYGVVIDLNGFTVRGPGHRGHGRGVSTGGVDRNYITVRNGALTGFGGGGVVLPGRYQRVENMEVSRNGGDGVAVGPHSVIVDNRIISNGGGLNVSRGESLIWRNMIQRNGGHGINGGGESWIESNTIEDNGGEGIFVTVGSLLRGNVVRRSGRNGLLLGMFSTVEGNEIRGSREAGVMTYGKSNRIIGNLIKENLGVGATLSGPDNYLARNTFQNNATGALAAATDDTIARNEHANIFLLDSGEADVAGVTRGATRQTEGWGQ